MILAPGTRIGAFHVEGLLGKGGMGEVYRARDTALGRDVAIKVLPALFRADPERLERFEREARTLATLNHPHIGAIYGIERSGGTPALVLELVEGPTLAERLAKGPLSQDEALDLAQQIAEALEAAHARGIVHRDLKPANIKIAGAGTIKVLDFGLAKLAPGDPAWPTDQSGAPTIAPTREGFILGTPAYMSPEQARGEDVDTRSDIWAFGCVLFEMLTGRRAFEGEGSSERLASVLKSDPDWNRLPARLPDSVRLVLRRCLQKDKRLRFHDVADVRILLDDARSAPVSQHVAAPSRGRARLPWIAVALALGAAAVALAWAMRPTPAADERLNMDIATAGTSSPASFAISPDGLKIAYVATSGTRSGLWLRSLNKSVDALPLPQTDGGEYPFWSPDSGSLGFFADRKLKVLDLASGTVQSRADAVPLGGTWSRDGTILFAQGYVNPLVRVTAKGAGEPVAVTRLEEHAHTSHRFPHFLPDGRSFLFMATGTRDTLGVHVSRLDEAGSRQLLSATGAVYAQQAGRLLFTRDGALFSQPFELDNSTLFGERTLVAEHVEADSALAVPVSAATTGTIAYRTTMAERQLMWFDRAGVALKRLGDAFNGGSIELSPNGGRIALHRATDGTRGIWLLDTDRGLFSRLRPDGVAGMIPIWSPKGERIVFSTLNGTVLSPHEMTVAGLDREKPFIPTNLTTIAQDWSADGWYLYVVVDPKTDIDLWAMPLDGSRKPFPIANNRATEQLGQFSPDHKSIAYMSNESGRFEIYVQPFPGPGSRTQVSLTGGGQPRWGRDSKELFYVAFDGQLMSVPIRTADNGRTVHADPGVPLFSTSIGGAVQGVEKHQYAVTRDGRFLMNTVVENAGSSRIKVVLDWKPTR